MYGKNFTGRSVSLLDSTTTTTRTTTNTTFTPPKLPNRSRPSTASTSSSNSREGYNSSRSSSSASLRHSNSPPTPPLSRLDSQSSLSQSTPSPMTPQYGFEPIDQHMKREQNQTPYYNQNFNRNGYPSMQDPTPQPYYNLSSQQPLPPMPDFDLDSNPYESHNQRGTLQPLQTQLQPAAYGDGQLSQLSPQSFHNQTPSSAHTNNTTATLPPITSAPAIKTDPTTPITTSNASSSSNLPNNKTPMSKKKYPCPHASRFSCTDTFTTSGHAARHGKKHTGEKNILCPTCNKAFTRKDNMKQHERTHKGGSSRSGSTAASPVISNKGVGSRKGSLASSDAMDLNDDGGVGLGLGGSLPSTMKRPKMQRSELSEIIEGISKSNSNETDDGSEGDMDADGEGESPGLDALATAASEMS